MTKQIIDCHVHLRDTDSCDRMIEIMDTVGLDRIGIVCTISSETINANAAALACKARYPDRVFVLCGLDHSARVPGGVDTPSLAEQVDRFLAMGADGIKMLEGKPTTRQWLDIPVDTDYFAEYFARAAETRIPILWHVNDPEEFWDPNKIPGWAKERNWGYDETHVQKEAQYIEIDNVLGRYPELNIIFAHFYFLSADLLRASDFLERNPSVNFDLAPGIEFLYNMSHDADTTREFFIRYADRIVFGTDISSGNTDEQAVARAGIITRWLETDDEYRVPPEVDFLLGKPEEGLMRGLSLPQDVLDKIYVSNFERICGARPKPLDAAKAAEECRRVAAIARNPEQAAKAASILDKM